MEPLDSQSKEELIALVLQLRCVVAEQAETLQLFVKRVEELQEEIARLKAGDQGKKPPPPDWVKPNIRPTQEKPASPKRKKRSHNFTWTRREPTKTVPHACDTCPDCGRGLSGGWEYSRHQIVEIPPIEVEVVDHVVFARHCGVCCKTCGPQVDTTQETVR